MILPGASETIQILLVEKDKVSLLQSYQRLGQTALDHSKDKFLVQSVAVDYNKAKQLQDYDQLTALWTSVTGAGSNVAVANKKLSVKHVVDPSIGAASTAPGSGASGIPGTGVAADGMDPSKLTPEQLVAELSGLRRKYDELVSFSVNLTAERDILNNTLEQTKRDLNRQIAKSAAIDNSSNNNAASQQPTSTVTKNNGGGLSLGGLLYRLVLLTICFVLGAHFQKKGTLKDVPIIENVLLPATEKVTTLLFPVVVTTEVQQEERVKVQADATVIPNDPPQRNEPELRSETNLDHQEL